MGIGMDLKEAQAAAYPEHAVHVNYVDNLIVTVGKALAADILIDQELGLSYHEIGTDATAPAAGDTDLTTSVERKIWTSRSRSANVLTLSVFYTSTDSTYSILEAGVWGGTMATATKGTGTLFSHYLQTYDNSGGLVDLTFDYNLTVG